MLATGSAIESLFWDAPGPGVGLGTWDNTAESICYGDGVMELEIERTTFAGHQGPDVITFACVKHGGYAILRNQVTVGVWGATDYAYCLNIFLRMIERRSPVEAANLLPCEVG